MSINHTHNAISVIIIIIIMISIVTIIHFSYLLGAGALPPLASPSALPAPEPPSEPPSSVTCISYEYDLI